MQPSSLPASANLRASIIVWLALLAWPLVSFPIICSWCGEMAFTASPVDPVVSMPTADLSPDVTSFWCSVAAVWPVAAPVSAEITVGSSLSNSCLQSANADPESLRVPHVRFEPKICGRFTVRHHPLKLHNGLKP